MQSGDAQRAPLYGRLLNWLNLIPADQIKAGDLAALSDALALGVRLELPGRTIGWVLADLWNSAEVWKNYRWIANVVRQQRERARAIGTTA
jgi:hypothetical protein